MTHSRYSSISISSPCVFYIIYFLICSTVQAQENVSSENIEPIEVITVNARKIEESTDKIPISLSEFSAKDIEKKALNNIVDLGLSSPNVNFYDSASTAGTSSAPTIFIRGVGQSDFLITSDPAVGFYIDGVYMPRMVGGTLDLLDLESALVLRGPQGSLYGRNTIGGAVLLTTTQPNDETDFYGKITLGERNLIGTRITANLPISEELATRFSFVSKKQDGYVTLTQYDDFLVGGTENFVTRWKTKWAPSDRFSLDFSVDYANDTSPPSAFEAVNINNDAIFINLANRVQAQAGYDECLTDDGRNMSIHCFGKSQLSLNAYQQNQVYYDEFSNPIKPKSDIKSGGSAIVLNWDTPIVSIKSISSWRKLDSKFYHSFNWGPEISFQNNNVIYDNQSFSQELQLSGNNRSNSLDWLLGMYWFAEEGQERVQILHAGGTLAPYDGSAAIYDNRVTDNVSQAIFGHLIWQINNKFQLSTGLRWSHENKRFSLDLGNRAFPDAEVRNGQQKVDDISPMLSLSYQYSDETMYYTSFSQGYRAGGFPARSLEPPNESAPLHTFQPEYLTVTEVGVKSQQKQKSINWQLALFNSKYQDKQESAIPLNAQGIGATIATQNIGDATIQGVEFQVNANLTDDIITDMSIGYLDSQWDNILGGGATGADGIVITKDKDLPYSPKWNIHIGVSSFHQVSNYGELQLRADWSYIDKQEFRSENISGLSQEGFAITHANMSFSPLNKNWTITLGVQNLFDKQYSTAGISNSNVHGMTLRNVSEPRTFYLSFSL